MTFIYFYSLHDAALNKSKILTLIIGPTFLVRGPDSPIDLVCVSVCLFYKILRTIFVGPRSCASPNLATNLVHF